MAFVSILSKIKLLFGPLAIQLVWYILKQLFTSVSVKVDGWIFTSTSVNNCYMTSVFRHPPAPTKAIIELNPYHCGCAF